MAEVSICVKPAESPKPQTATQPKSEAWSSDGIEMVFVKGGTFTMGCTGEQGSEGYDNEKPAHRVTVSDFHIGK